MRRPRTRSRRARRPLLLVLGAVAVAGATAACGSERITVPHSSPYYQGAVIFSQHCSGCHTLTAAGTRGSPANIRNATSISGPDFDQRCERPVTRVLYAIENGGFSGAYMPQNVVVGQQAREVAEFVAHYAGSQAVFQPGVPGSKPCRQTPIGTLPPANSAGIPILSTTATTTATTAGTGTTATTASAGTTATTASAGAAPRAKRAANSSRSRSKRSRSRSRSRARAKA
jgi:mono/diheme cytochrome c family protein